MADFIDISGYNMTDLPEGEMYNDGTELQARITNIIKGVDKNGDDYLMPWFEDPENVNLEDFSDYIPLPGKKDTPKDQGRKLRTLKAFITAFGLESMFQGEFSLDDAKGAVGWMILGIGKNKEGKPCNRPKKYLDRA
jgi:hypothetical protein